MSKYLYGANVQGIQGFIFQTNKLREIIGASYLVDDICTEQFRRLLPNKKPDLASDENLIMSAAGNVKYLFEDKKDCEQVVRLFPKVVSNYAPGITISQAVVKTTGDLKEDIRLLEKHLRSQRNKATAPVDTGFMGLERARKTGGVAFANNIHAKSGEHKLVDRATDAKLTKTDDQLLQLFRTFKGSSIKAEDVPFDISHITQQKDSSWIAIIHADGNGLGLLLQNMGEKLKGDAAQKTFSDFSKNLDKATKEAVKIAFRRVIAEKEEEDIKRDKKLCFPMRPVILGGDDLTLIIRADLAFDFTVAYLQAFEDMTEKYLGQKLTACAGIAYIKETYPFHYGAHLAEGLTAEAKKFSKSIHADPNIMPPASLSFYKVQASFTKSVDEMKTKTLFPKRSGIRLDYGPYLLHRIPKPATSNYDRKGELPYIQQLTNGYQQLKDFANADKSTASKLRQWATLIYEDKAKADFLLDRMQQQNASFATHINLSEERKKDCTMLYELIQLYHFQNQD